MEAEALEVRKAELANLLAEADDPPLAQCHTPSPSVTRLGSSSPERSSTG